MAQFTKKQLKRTLIATIIVCVIVAGLILGVFLKSYLSKTNLLKDQDFAPRACSCTIPTSWA